MKWVNGSIIETIAKDALLAVSLCEAPYIFGSTTRGVDPGLVYTYWRILEIAKSIKTMYAGPGMNYCPVDVLVGVLAVNALARRPLGHLRPCNVEPYDNELLATLLGCSLASWDEFYEQARGASPPKQAVDAGAASKSALPDSIAPARGRGTARPGDGDPHVAHQGGASGTARREGTQLHRARDADGERPEERSAERVGVALPRLPVDLLRRRLLAGSDVRGGRRRRSDGARSAAER